MSFQENMKISEWAGWKYFTLTYSTKPLEERAKEALPNYTGSDKDVVGLLSKIREKGHLVDLVSNDIGWSCVVWVEPETRLCHSASTVHEVISGVVLQLIDKENSK
jgi:hypothetical protein